MRNMRRAGISQNIRMKISGHKTEAMERRYNIVDDEDLTIAKKRMEAVKRNRSALLGASSRVANPFHSNATLPQATDIKGLRS